MQVRDAFGAAHFAQGLRRMAERLGTQRLSESQLQMGKDLAESLVALLEQVGKPVERLQRLHMSCSTFLIIPLVGTSLL